MTHTKPIVYVLDDETNKLLDDGPNLVQLFLKHNAQSDKVIFCNSPQKADVIVVFHRWSFKLPEYAKELSSNLLFKSYADKIFVINYDDTVHEGFLPGCYVSLRKSSLDPQRFKACAYPLAYNEHINGTNHKGYPCNEFLFSFRGNLNSAPIRSLMFNALKNVKDACMVDNSKAFHTHTQEDKQIYAKELLNSKFILCPRGHSPATYRMFESMRAGKCPVIIADEWVEIDGPNWAECSIRIAEKDVIHLEATLRERIHDAKRLGDNARREWQAHFSEKARYKFYLNQIIDLYSTTPSITKSPTAYEKHWRSRSFLVNNRWTIRQKVMRKLSRLFLNSR